MRAIALCLLVTTALLGTRPGTLQAGEDDDTDLARLERRVEMLLDLVAELRTEVLELRERIAKLEAAPTDRILREGERKTESIPATPIEPMPILQWADVSGVYVFDGEATIEAMSRIQVEGVEDEETAEEIRQGIASMFEGMEITLRMEKNGTFFVRLTEPGAADESTARGTWTRDVSHVSERQRLVLTTTHEDGEEQEDPDDIVGIWKNGLLRLEEPADGDSGFVMIFHRK